MLENPVKRKLTQGKAVVGTWLNLGDPIAAEAIAALGFDWRFMGILGDLRFMTAAAKAARDAIRAE